MPDENSKTEATLADLAVSLVLGRTPALADHYLGFELIPGTVNENKTRAAGLLGFRIGQETVCIPVLFLNGKIKGTEVLYLKDSDVFTSNTRPWVDYLLSKDSSTMGQGAQHPVPLQRPSIQGMRVFSRNPATVTKSAEFFEGAAKEFWEKIATVDIEDSAPEVSIKDVFKKLGRKAYIDFMETMEANPEVFAKIAQKMDVEKDLFIDEWPEEPKTAAAEDQHEVVFDPEIVCIRSEDLLGTNKEASNGRGGWSGLVKEINQDADTNLFSLLVKKGPGEFSRANDRRMGGEAIGFLGAPVLGAGLGALVNGSFTEDSQERKRRRLVGALVGAGAGLAAAPLTSAIGGLVGVKTASLDSIPNDIKEKCLTDGIAFIDKRAEDSTSIVMREDYRQRFSQPDNNGFYDVLNTAGEITPVFIARAPFLIEDPRTHIAGVMILDVDSGVFALPAEGNQVFVRSRLTTNEAAWKEKFSGMQEVKSMQPQKSYVLVSPSLEMSSPFRVNGKTKDGEETFFKCRSPWEIESRATPKSSSNCYPCTPVGFGGSGDVTVRISSDDGESVRRVGNIVFVPSSWRVFEVYGESGSLTYDNTYVPPQESAEEKSKRLERAKKRKAYIKIEPGNEQALNYASQTKDTFKVTFKKEGSGFRIISGGVATEPMSRNDMLESMVMELDMPLDKVAEIANDATTGPEVDVWVMFRGHEEMFKEAEEEMRKVAAQLPNSSAEEILPMQGVAPFLGDLVGPYMASRAGRATAMARAAGADDEDIPFRVRHPLTGSLLDSLGGGALGAVIGGSLGYGGKALMQGLGVSRDRVPGINYTGEPPEHSARASAGGAGLILGGGLGLLAGTVANFIKRRQFARMASKAFDATSPEKRDANAVHPDTNKWVTNPALLFNANYHRTGERDTYAHIKGKAPLPSHRLSEHLAIPASMVVAPLGAAGPVGHAIVNGVNIALPMATGIVSQKELESSGEPTEQEKRRREEVERATPQAWADKYSGGRLKAADAQDVSDPIAKWARSSHGLNGDVIYGGMDIPEMNTELGENISGIPEQIASSVRQPIDLMNPLAEDPENDWRNMDAANWDKIQKKDLDFLMRVADSGSRNVLESNMISLLLRTNRVSEQVREWIPDLVNSLDTKGRLLLSFYWHSQDFADDYGKDELSSFEDILQNAIKADGQLVLFLKQNAADASNAKVNPFD